MKWNLLFVSVTIYNTVAFSQYNEALYASKLRGVVENTINATLNKIRDRIPEPITISSIPFDFEEGEALSGGLNVTSIIITGLKGFETKEINANILQQEIDLKIIVPEVNIVFKYWADVLLLSLVPFYGEGMMSISFDEIEIAVNGGATWKEGPRIKNISVLIILSEATFDLSGMINNPEYSALISTAFTDNFANLVNQNAHLISKTISPIVEAVLNSYLEPTAEKILVKGMNVVVKS